MASVANVAVTAAPRAVEPPAPTRRRLRLGFLTHLLVGADAADSYRIALELFEPGTHSNCVPVSAICGGYTALVTWQPPPGLG